MPLFLARSGLAIVLGERQAGPFTSLYTCSRLRWVFLPNHLPTSVCSRAWRPDSGESCYLSFRHCTVPLLPLLTNQPWRRQAECPRSWAEWSWRDAKNKQGEEGGRVECSWGDKGLERWVGLVSWRWLQEGASWEGKTLQKETTARPATPAALGKVYPRVLWESC